MKAEVQAKPPTACKSRKNGGSRVGELEKHLAEALEQQAATAGIPRVISRSQLDVHPGFDAIVQSAVRLCDGVHGNVFLFDGELLHWMAGFNLDQEAQEALRRQYPRPDNRGLPAARAG